MQQTPRVPVHLRNALQRRGTHRPRGGQRDWAVEAPWVDAADPAGVPAGKGPTLPPPTGTHVWKTGQKALAASSDAKARVIQTGPSAGEIIPKEE